MIAFLFSRTELAFARSFSSLSLTPYYHAISGSQVHAPVSRTSEMSVEKSDVMAVWRYCVKTPYSDPGCGDEELQKIWTFPGMSGTGPGECK